MDIQKPMSEEEFSRAKGELQRILQQREASASRRLLATVALFFLTLFCLYWTREKWIAIYFQPGTDSMPAMGLMFLVMLPTALLAWWSTLTGYSKAKFEIDYLESQNASLSDVQLANLTSIIQSESEIRALVAEWRREGLEVKNGQLEEIDAWYKEKASMRLRETFEKALAG